MKSHLNRTSHLPPGKKSCHKRREEEPKEEEPAVEPTVIIPKSKLKKRKRKKIRIRTSHYDRSNDFEEESGFFEEKGEGFSKLIQWLRWPILVIAVFILVWMVLFLEETDEYSPTRQVRLLSPQKKAGLLSKAEMQRQFKQVASHYKRDTMSSYFKGTASACSDFRTDKKLLLGICPVMFDSPGALALCPSGFHRSKSAFGCSGSDQSH